MKPKTYTILSQAVEDGVKRGYNRAFKHVENLRAAAADQLDHATSAHTLCVIANELEQ